MNIFALHDDPVKAAQSHGNKHVVKMILESAQLLCTTMRLHGIDYGYRITHQNHPCRLWLEESKENFKWLKELGLALCREYTHRYGKIHKTQSVLEGCKCPDDISDKPRTKFALAMPVAYKTSNPILSYRQYYLNEKRNLLDYKNRQPPEWINQ